MRRLIVLILALTLVACAPAPATAGPTTPGEPPATASLTVPAPSGPPTIVPTTCPNPQRGGWCLGELLAGTYTTVAFKPSITYVVPTDGWANWEDLPGLFLLLPPGESLDGVDADTSDFIGIYGNVAVAATNCDESAEPGVGQSAAAMAGWYAGNPGLDVAEPKPVAIGGLTGLMVEVSIAPSWTTACPFAPGVPLVPLIVGSGFSAGLHHVMQAGYRTRLYVLDHGSNNLVIEVVDHAGRLGFDDYAPVVEGLRFGSD